jgi:hypothetical protein
MLVKLLSKFWYSYPRSSTYMAFVHLRFAVKCGYVDKMFGVNRLAPDLRADGPAGWSVRPRPQWWGVRPWLATDEGDLMPCVLTALRARQTLRGWSVRPRPSRPALR